MVDDKRKRGGPDRRRVAKGQAYEVTRKHGLTAAESWKLLARSGGSREKANRMAEQQRR
jgi:hypothetical protein